jgi:UDP-glucose 4-epimerase
MSRVLVTGGLGFIGSHLVELLLSEGHQISVLDNLSSESSSRANMREVVQYWIDDIRNINSYKYVGEKFDTVFHLAALSRIQPSFQAPLDTLSVNIQGTACVLEFARRCGANVVYAGSSSAYAGPMLNPYAYAKYTGEQVCEMYSKIYGMNTATARFFNVYGARQPIVGPYATVVGIFEEQKKKGMPLTVTGDGEQRRDFTHVSDIVKGLYALSKGDCRGEVYNLGTGRNHSINELAGLFEPKEIKYIPARPGEARTTLADISLTGQTFGWAPNMTLEKYVKEFLTQTITK